MSNETFASLSEVFKALQTESRNMVLTIAERKHLMPYGAQREVCAEQGLKEAYVSLVMNDLIRPKTAAGKKRLRRVQVALARKLGKPVDEVFPQTSQEAAPTLARAS